ncbi:uncharacterized protein LOC101241401 [Hydra vulgaris]|uniref:uncharacterized protein LOC101241401 n=1 Tax=Hydra vulgaris TaxID=6087 RepID=UPI0002B45D65|nr:uncharacterized protein LOC101241401 [Hydra vulgaris]
MIKVLIVIFVLINSVFTRCNYMRWSGCEDSEEAGKSNQEAMSKLGLLFQSKFSGKKDPEVKLADQREDLDSEKFNDELNDVLRSNLVNFNEKKPDEKNEGDVNHITEETTLSEKNYKIFKKMDNIIHSLMGIPLGIDQFVAKNRRK